MALSMGSPFMHEITMGVRDRAVLACRDHALDDGPATWGHRMRSGWVRDGYEDGDPVVRQLLDANVLCYALDAEPILDLGEPFLRSAIEWTTGIEPEVRPEDVEPLGRALDAPTNRFLDLALAERGARQGDDMDVLRTFRRWLERRYREGDPEVRDALGLALAKRALVPYGKLPLDRPLHALAMRGLSDYIVPSDGDATRSWDEGWNGGGHILGAFRSRGTEFEVVMYDRGGPAEPHVHLRRPRSPRTPDVCVSLVRAAYVPHGDATRELGVGQVEDLAAYLSEVPEHGTRSDPCRWMSFLGEWDYWRDEDHGGVDMPDYLQLGRRDGGKPHV